ncbi:MAG: helix-turn-helix domain-containing protein [Eubacteriales bacterium]|nr:helix-turn-helix domain-containing protein [Eubacteriales bacterium]
MEFEDLLLRARQSDKEALLEIIELYRPLMIKYAIVDKKLDEDLYQELVYRLLVCIMKFPYTKE